MASAAQVLANRLNARKSTGPRTPKGKTVVSQNAVKHGLLAKEVVIKGEDPGEFEFYRDQMLGELAPVGQVEAMLAERVVSLSWQLQRAERLQGAAFDALDEKHEKPMPVLSPELQEWVLSQATKLGLGDPDPADEDRAVGRMIVKDFADARILDRLLMYERRIEHSLYRTMAELQKQRLLRELEPTTEQSCKTKPIPPGIGESQVPCGTEAMNDSPQNGLGKTNPISSGEGYAGWLTPVPPDADRALQPQCPCFPLAPSAGDGHNEHGGPV